MMTTMEAPFSFVKEAMVEQYVPKIIVPYPTIEELYALSIESEPCHTFMDETSGIGRKWLRGYKEMLAFVMAHNRLPRNSDDIKLFNWRRFVERKRRSYKEKRKYKALTDKQIELLEKIPGWEINDYDAAWNKHFDDFAAYVKENKKLPSCDNKKLYYWRRRQIELYDKWINNKLSPHMDTVYADRFARMDTIPGWM